MSNEKCETARECDEHLAIKNGSSGNSNVTPGILLNRIKFEDSELDWDECGIDIKEAVKTEIKNGWKVNSGSEGFEVPDTIEQGFIKNEADQDTEEISEMDLNSMKSEPSNDDWDECDAGNQSILDTDVDELEMGMYSKIKEEPFIKDEMDDNTERISDILLRRIKNEYNKVDELPECSITENLNIHLREIKSEIDICEEFNKKEMASEGTIENETLNGISNAFSNR
nr:unnamed protein product [Callosobruchus chinensis]